MVATIDADDPALLRKGPVEWALGIIGLQKAAYGGQSDDNPLFIADNEAHRPLNNLVPIHLAECALR